MSNGVGVLFAAVVTLAAARCDTGQAAPGRLVLHCDFEAHAVGEPPPGWAPFTRGTRVDVAVAELAAGKCLRGARTPSGGWVALTREFPAQSRVIIEFSFALAGSAPANSTCSRT